LDFGFWILNGSAGSVVGNYGERKFSTASAELTED